MLLYNDKLPQNLFMLNIDKFIETHLSPLCGGRTAASGREGSYDVSSRRFYEDHNYRGGFTSRRINGITRNYTVVSLNQNVRLETGFPFTMRHLGRQIGFEKYEFHAFKELFFKDIERVTGKDLRQHYDIEFATFQAMAAELGDFADWYENGFYLESKSNLRMISVYRINTGDHLGGTIAGFVACDTLVKV